MVTEESISFREYFKKSKLLQFGFVFNLISLTSVASVFIYLTLIGSVDTTVYSMDFQVFYESGQAFLSSPDSIYTVNPNGLPYRYLPIFAAVMSVFVGVPLSILYLLNITMMTVLHLCTVYLVFRVSFEIGVTTATKNFEKTLTIVAITPPHVVNLILGQISQLVILLLLVALFILLHSPKESYAPFLLVGILIGIASTLKPFCLVFIPFLIPLTIIGRSNLSLPLKPFFGIFSGLFLSMSPNLLYFITYPSTINEFLQVNLAEGLATHHSTSITKLVMVLLPFVNSQLLMFSIIILLGGLIFLRSYITFVRDDGERKNYTHYFTEVMFFLLLAYPDSWFLFIAFLYAFLAPSMLRLYRFDGAFRYLDVLWDGANNLMAFFSLGIVIHYLFLGFDPINPIWIATLYVLYHRLYRNSTKSNSMADH